MSRVSDSCSSVQSLGLAQIAVATAPCSAGDLWKFDRYNPCEGFSAQYELDDMPLHPSSWRWSLTTCLKAENMAAAVKTTGVAWKGVSGHRLFLILNYANYSAHRELVNYYCCFLMI